MKPEVSLAAIGSLPSEAAKAKARLNVSADVVTVRTTSTSAMSGTGLKKCSPTNRSARLVAPAISAIVRLEVLDAKIVPWPQSASSSLKSAFFSARSEEHTSELQSQSNLVCRLLLEKKKKHTSDNSRLKQHNI